MEAIQQRPHHDAVKALGRELLGLVAAVDEDDAVYSRRDEIDSFYDRIFDYHAAKPPGEFAERVREGEEKRHSENERERQIVAKIEEDKERLKKTEKNRQRKTDS